MARTDTMDIVVKAMFDSSVELSETDALMLARLRDVYTFWLEKPTLTDSKIRDYLMVNHKISRSQAYTDIAHIKMVLGNVPVANKEFFRYKANHILDEAHTAATAGNDKKAKALTKIAEAIVLNNRTNIDDGEKLPFDEIVPKDLSFSIDPAVAGVKPIPGIKEKTRKLLEKYSDEIEFDTTPYDYKEETDIPE